MKHPADCAPHDFIFSRYCGADVCTRCRLHVHLDREGKIHQELARCFCGWSLSGRDGTRELVELGETIEPEDY